MLRLCFQYKSLSTRIQPITHKHLEESRKKCSAGSLCGPGSRIGRAARGRVSSFWQGTRAGTPGICQVDSAGTGDRLHSSPGLRGWPADLCGPGQRLPGTDWFGPPGEGGNVAALFADTALTTESTLRTRPKGSVSIPSFMSEVGGKPPAPGRRGSGKLGERLGRERQHWAVDG
ncbi:hypothetical protein chiPu_0009675 [Chiloscyllium punctatum]|uniref:Uncharacterized protein n=1 Tax=Chiloscyllium punctatum TaxID=137246 RepID=A0A401SLH0_CHIPU|nr:hypothetical protein [Chiloscyllium punctatum]